MSPLPLVRCERLEEQLNDLTELHQNEILNLKQELASMEEKIAYQSYERARDIQVSTVGQVEKQKAEKAEWWFPGVRGRGWGLGAGYWLMGPESQFPKMKRAWR